MLRNPKHQTAFDQVLAKYDRAKEHIEEFDSRLTKFRNSNPDKIGRKVDPKTGDVVLYVVEMTELLPEFSTIAGDAIHNLRSALDHLVCRMIEAAGNKPTNASCFPICDTPEIYKTAAPLKVKGLRKRAIQKIDSIHPYKGGNDPLWQLHRLDIIDKHRLLLALALTSLAHTMAQSQRAKLSPGGVVMPGLGVFVDFPPPREPLRAGSELLRIPAAEVDENMKFFVDVTIYEPGVAENAPLYMVLEFIRAEVLRVIFDLAPFV